MSNLDQNCNPRFSQVLSDAGLHLDFFFNHSNELDSIDENSFLQTRPHIEKLFPAGMKASCKYVLEAAAICHWLREAGLEDLAERYEDGYFPVDVELELEQRQFLSSGHYDELIRRHLVRLNGLSLFLPVHLSMGDESLVGAGSSNICRCDLRRSVSMPEDTNLEKDAVPKVKSPVSKRVTLPGSPSTWLPPGDVSNNDNNDSALTPSPVESPTSSFLEVPKPHSSTPRSPDLLRSASLRLRTALSTFRRDGFRSLRRKHKSPKKMDSRYLTADEVQLNHKDTDLSSILSACTAPSEESFCTARTSAEPGSYSQLNLRTGSFYNRVSSRTPTSDNKSNTSDDLDVMLENLYTDIRTLRKGFKSVPTSPRLPSASEGPSTAEVMAGLNSGLAELDILLDQRRSLPLEAPRRDSGLDSPTNTIHSYTTPPTELSSLEDTCTGIRRGAKFRWSSFARSHRPSIKLHDMQVAAMSISQMIVLKNAYFLEINRIMQEYCPPNKSLLSWFVPKFLKRSKPAPNLTKTAVFGVPLTTVQMRCGQPLPSSIVHVMRQLRQSGVSAHGIFRRTGGKARVQILKGEIDANPDKSDFSHCQPYDLADLLKTFLREIPECLMSPKLSTTLIDIFSHVTNDSVRLKALQAVMVLLPDENREVLQSLLYFLHDFAENHQTTQMTASNLAVCLTPSLFYFSHETATTGLSPRRFRRVTGVPDPKDLADNKSATNCLTFMINNCHQLFTVPEELLRVNPFFTAERAEPPELDSLAPIDASQRRHCFAFVDNHGILLTRECAVNCKGWTAFSNRQGVEVAFKKLEDSCPLRLWKACTLINAESYQILDKIVQDRLTWDPDVLKAELLEPIDDNADVFRFTLTSPPAQPAREQCVLRAWRSTGAHSHSLYCASVRAPPTPLTLPTLILNEDWLIEGTGQGSSRVTLLSRVDLRGHSLDWYNKTWGHNIARQLVNLNRSFRHSAKNSSLRK